MLNLTNNQINGRKDRMIVIGKSNAFLAFFPVVAICSNLSTKNPDIKETKKGEKKNQFLLVCKSRIR